MADISKVASDGVRIMHPCDDHHVVTTLGAGADIHFKTAGKEFGPRVIFNFFALRSPIGTKPGPGLWHRHDFVAPLAV